MDELAAGGNVDELLEELLEKKRWLDTMIAGLEAAKESPQHQLIEMVAEKFASAGGRGPKVDLKSDSKQELAKLAKRVGHPGRRKGARRPD